MIKKKQYEIFHPTFFDDYFLPYLGNKPFVLTIHDMAEDDHKVRAADTVKHSDLQEGCAEDLYESCRSRSRNIK